MTNIQIIKGNIFETDCECVVNTTNSIGVMGKGIALEFKKRFPKECKAYNIWSKQTQNTYLQVLLPPKIVKSIVKPINICFLPTKIHWRNPSKLEYLERNIPQMLCLLEDRNIKSVAMPWPGCGNGGLNKEDVYKIISEYNHLYTGKIIINEQ